MATANPAPAADPKATRPTSQAGQPVRSSRALLEHLGTLTRADIRHGTDPNLPTVATLTAATSTQRRAFELLDATIPLTLT